MIDINSTFRNVRDSDAKVFKCFLDEHKSIMTTTDINNIQFFISSNENNEKIALVCWEYGENIMAKYEAIKELLNIEIQIKLRIKHINEINNLCIIHSNLA